MADSTQRGIDRLLMLAKSNRASHRGRHARRSPLRVPRQKRTRTRRRVRTRSALLSVDSHARRAKPWRGCVGADSNAFERRGPFAVSDFLRNASERRSRLDRWALGFIDRLTRQEKELEAWGLQREDLEALSEGREKIQSRSTTKIKAFPSEGDITKMLGDPWPLLYSQIFACPYCSFGSVRPNSDE
jgi:hypothetical protein